MKKTLGGDRLGAGKKMEVDLHNYGRSNQNLSYIWRSTMSIGTLVPFMCKVAQTGDSIDIDLHLNMMTHPTVGPAFGTGKVQMDIFLCPIRLYQGQLHNNKLGIGMNMAAIKLPELTLKAPFYEELGFSSIKDIDNLQINPSSILAYLGIRGIGMNNQNEEGQERTFNGVPLLAYWDIYKNYYSNKQEEIGVVVHSTVSPPIENVSGITINGDALTQAPTQTAIPLIIGDSIFYVTRTATQDFKDIMINTGGGASGWSQPLTTIATFIDEIALVSRWAYNSPYGTATAVSWSYRTPQDLGSTINLEKFNLSQIDKMREDILVYTDQTTPFPVLSSGIYPYAYLIEEDAGFRALMESQEGLGVKTYNSDLFNNWLSTEWIDGAGGISEVTAIDTSTGEFTIDTLNLAKKVYDMLNRIAVSGGTYDDWLDAVYTHDRFKKAETPMYMGGRISELVFQEVVSQSESGGQGQGVQPLGTLAGRGTIKGQKGGHVNIKVDEPSYVIGIVSITPRIDYSQGNEWDTQLKTMDDLHKPALDEIGFQELVCEKMAWWDTNWDGTNWVTKSAGKQPAWIDYMTSTNQVRGNFAIENNEMFMVFTRRYQAALGVNGVEIKDLTTYIDPRKFNHIFAQTSLDSQNIWCQIGVDMNVRRKISAKLIPNL